MHTLILRFVRKTLKLPITNVAGGEVVLGVVVMSGLQSDHVFKQILGKCTKDINVEYNTQ